MLLLGVGPALGTRLHSYLDSALQAARLLETPMTSLFHEPLPRFRGCRLRQQRLGNPAEPRCQSGRRRPLGRLPPAYSISVQVKIRAGRATVTAAVMVAAMTEAFDTGERSEEHTSELQSLRHLVCRLMLEK